VPFHLSVGALRKHTPSARTVTSDIKLREDVGVVPQMQFAEGRARLMNAKRMLHLQSCYWLLLTCLVEPNCQMTKVNQTYFLPVLKCTMHSPSTMQQVKKTLCEIGFGVNCLRIIRKLINGELFSIRLTLRKFVKFF
jgi:hypothetical protein